MTLIEGRAGDRIAARAGPSLAGVGLGTGVAVIARRAVWLRRVRTDACRGVACAGYVTLVERRADDRVAARAGPSLAGVGLGTGVAVIAGRAVWLRRVRTDACRRIARAGVVALIGGCTDDRNVQAGVQTRIARIGSARVAV